MYYNDCMCEYVNIASEKESAAALSCTNKYNHVYEYYYHHIRCHKGCIFNYALHALSSCGSAQHFNNASKRCCPLKAVHFVLPHSVQLRGYIPICNICGLMSVCRHIIWNSKVSGELLQICIKIYLCGHVAWFSFTYPLIIYIRKINCMYFVLLFEYVYVLMCLLYWTTCIKAENFPFSDVVINGTVDGYDHFFSNLTFQFFINSKFLRLKKLWFFESEKLSFPASRRFWWKQWC